MTIHAIIASHNRRATTLQCLDNLRVAASRAKAKVQVHLFDDGSVDGTASAVQGAWPGARVLHGDGDQFWARSMASAEASALELAGPEDLILWLNDDTNLDPSALLTLTSTFESHPSSILVGATRSAGEIEAVTYGGLIRDGIHPLRFRLASVSTKPVPVDSFNGNVVMVPSVVAHELGGIDGRYSHAWADIDYGLRATQQGREVLQVPGTVGVCERNPPQPHDTFRASWRQFRSKKGGGEPHSLRRIVAVARPRTWWVFVAWTNLSFALKWVIRDLRERTQGG